MISDPQTSDICGHSGFTIRGLCADALFFQGVFFDLLVVCTPQATTSHLRTNRSEVFIGQNGFASESFSSFPQISGHFLFLYLELLVASTSPVCVGSSKALSAVSW